MDWITDDPEQLWAALLSEEAERIRRAWKGLTDEEAAAVRAHLERMAAGEGYSAGQRQAATTALRALSADRP